MSTILNRLQVAVSAININQGINTLFLTFALQKSSIQNNGQAI